MLDALRPPARRRGTTARYPGDFTGRVDPLYSPEPDGQPDPGEIVWTWVPYEEDHSQGKDRPVLVVGHDGPWLLALQLTSKDHDRDEAQERRAGRLWVDIGAGPWDRQGRPSEVRVNRVVRIDPAAVRREGSVLPRDRFDAVVAGMRAARR
ncbi:MAG TPA: type II toxin-antitoxin system PemK/MazF family toxin [Phycicoccus sp.]|nr:type II toxin-antitoxin system PemK/MazF family toxin [Phycicoccus sp.]